MVMLFSVEEKGSGLTVDALALMHEVCLEFSRVEGKNLEEDFFNAFDRLSPSLMDLFRKKKGLAECLAELLHQTKTTEPTDIRSLCLRGLPVILGDDPSAFFKTAKDGTDEDSFSQTPV